MNNRSKLYLRNALDEASELSFDLAGLSLQGFEDSRLYRRMSERSLEVIGEAIRRALDRDTDLESNYPKLREWVALRNVLSHQYDNIQPEAVWAAATEELSDLIALIETILDDYTDNGPI